jgi:hypothetical protein
MRLHHLGLAADVNGDPERLRTGIDCGDFGAIFDLDAARR